MRFEKAASDMVVRRLEAIAKSLRELADEADRARNRIISDDRPDYVFLTSDLTHDIMWALVNMRPETLIGAAADAERARAVGEAAEDIASKVEATIGGYPDNEVERPKVERGEHLSDFAWAAQIARERGAKES